MSTAQLRTFFALCLAALFLACPSFAGLQFGPWVVPIQGLPKNSKHHYACLYTENGDTLIVTHQGLLMRTGSTWTLHKTPVAGTTPRLALQFPDGTILLAGSPFCEILRHNRWTDTGLKDDILMGIVAENTALLASSEAVYSVNSDGTHKRLLTLSGGYNSFHRIGGKVYLFSSLDGVFVHQNDGFVPAGTEMDWARKHSISYVVEAPEGLIAATEDGVMRVKEGHTNLLLPEFLTPAANRRQKVRGMAIEEDLLLVADYETGLTAYNLKTHTRDWNIPCEAIQGNLYSMCQSPEGLIIGAYNGSSLLLTPSHYALAQLPPKALNSINATSQGTLLAVGGRGLFLDGKELQVPAGSIAVCERDDGALAYHMRDGVLINGQRTRPPKGAAYGLSNSGSICAVTNGASFLLLLPDGKEARQVPLPSPSYEIERDGTDWIVGTAQGAYRISPEGTIQSHIGTGRAQVRFLGNTKKALVLDEHSNLYDGQGRQLAQLPFAHLGDTAVFEEHYVLLDRTPDQVPWVGLFSPQEARWKPLDLPMPDAPTGMAAEDGYLYVVAAESVLRVKAPRYLPPLKASVRLSDAEGRPLDKNLLVPTEQKSVWVEFPKGRIAPWANPQFEYKLDEDAWLPAGPGQRIEIARLPYGESRLQVRACMAHQETLTSFTLVHRPPLWQRWPAFVAYATSLSALLFGVLVWRSRQLARKERQLEALITERTRELKETQASRERFFTTLSHELKNPLNGVVGLCEMLHQAPKEAVAPREQSLIRNLKGCAEQLRGILDEVLDFGQIDRGEIRLKECDFKLAETIEGALRAIDPLMKDCCLSIEPESKELSLHGDPGKLRQIISNLVSNALKYGEPRLANVSCRMKPGPGGSGHTLHLIVCNHGKTFSSEELLKFFDDFVRGEEAKRKGIPGSGLGLSIARRLAQAMGGTLEACSGAGETSFILQVPFKAALEAPTSADTSKKAELAPHAGLQVFAIEDEPYNRLVLGHYLQNLGFETEWAGTKAEAMEGLLHGHYDLILMDFMLPDANGPALLKALPTERRKQLPPVVMISAYSSPEKIQEAKDAGVVIFANKPFTQEAIARAAKEAGVPLRSARQRKVGASDSLRQFSPLGEHPEARSLLAQVSTELLPEWNEARQTWTRGESQAARRLIHRLRSQLLSLGAGEESEQAGLLEAALGEHRDADTHLLAASLEPRLKDLVRRIEESLQQS